MVEKALCIFLENETKMVVNQLCCGREKTAWFYDLYTEFGAIRRAGFMPLSTLWSLIRKVSIVLFIFE
jgi:hypothetical protein